MLIKMVRNEVKANPCPVRAASDSKGPLSPTSGSWFNI